VAEGVCFGYRVRSPLSFAYLRDARGDEPCLDVEVADRDDPGPEGTPARVWRPRPGHPFHARLFAEPDGWRMWIDGTGSYWIDPSAPRVEVPPDAPPIPREERLWGIPAVLCFLARGDHSIHAAAVEVGGSAIVIAAPGRFGKTTLASAFTGAGHRLLAEDSTCLRIGDDGTSVVPGPAMLRVRRDSFERLTLPGTTVLAQDEERVHLATEQATRGDGTPVPLRHVILLRTSEDDEIRLERVPAEAVIPDVWTLSFNVPTDEGRTQCFENATRLAATIPVWNLSRPLRYELLDDVMDAIVAGGT
jgi:hypothetical protein